jgi:hypothetical protein
MYAFYENSGLRHRDRLVTPPFRSDSAGVEFHWRFPLRDNGFLMALFVQRTSVMKPKIVVLVLLALSACAQQQPSVAPPPTLEACDGARRP